MAIEASSLLKGRAPSTRWTPTRCNPSARVVKLAGYIRWVYAGPDDQTAIALLDEGRFVLVDLDAGQVLDEGDVGFVPDPSDFSPDGHRVAVSGGVGGCACSTSTPPNGSVPRGRATEGVPGRWPTPRTVPFLRPAAGTGRSCYGTAIRAPRWAEFAPGHTLMHSPSFFQTDTLSLFPRTTGPSTHGIPDPRPGSRLPARSQVAT